MADPIGTLADHALGLRYDRLPAALVATLKMAMIDTVGAILAGRYSLFGRTIIQRALETGGRGEAQLIGAGLRIPVAEAAFANAILGRCLELDDVHEGSPRTGYGHGGHINIAVMPAVLAALDVAPSPVAGTEVLAAMAAGGDLIARIRLAAGEAGRLGWEGPTVAPFGVVAAAGRILGLDRQTLLHAMSAAYSQCAGNVQSTTDGGWDVWLNAGTAARSGMLAVDLARRGFLGTSAPLLGTSGLYPLYFRGEYHEDALTGQLGEFFESQHVSVKPYASCKATHNAIYTAMRLQRDRGLAVQDIRRIVIHTSRYSLKLVGLDGSGQPKPMPSDVGKAQFHLGFTVATGLVHGTVMPDVLEAALHDPDVQRLSEATEVLHSAAKDKLQKQRGYQPDDVTIEMTDGSSFTACEPYTIGHPSNPMSRSEVAEKFRNCIRLGMSPGGHIDAPFFLDLVDRLEDLPDARLLCRALA